MQAAECLEPRSSRALHDIEKEIAELAAHMAVAEYRMLCAIREFDLRGGYYQRGAKSTAHWLSWRIGLDLGAAREKVRVARALADLPRVSDSLRRGKISYSKVRALSRIATRETEAELLEIAEHGTASHVEKVVRLYRSAERGARADHAMMQYGERRVTVSYDEAGMLILRAALPPEDGAKVVKALDAATDALFEADANGPPATGTIPYNQRRADALVRVAESALSVEASSPSRVERYQVVVHVDAESLPDTSRAQPNPANDSKVASDSPRTALVLGDNRIEDGPRISAETCRRLSCDADVVEMRHGSDGSVLDVGRKTRKISPALSRALKARDQGCRWPGCTHSRFLQAHHVEHWSDGGATKLENLLYVCGFHHRLVHEGGFVVKPDGDGGFVFETADGEPIPPTGDVDLSHFGIYPDVDVLEHFRRLHQERGVVVSDKTLGSWAGERMDYGWTLEWLLSKRCSDMS
jgi:hypothetical protein